VTSPNLRVIRQSSFTATPWKNGGGITHEAIRVPASGDPFRWRVSVAHIDASGPFSDFSAYQRTMVLLRGAGVELRFADGDTRTLRKVGEMAEFDGALPTYCHLLNGPCVDLNLMVLKSDPVTAGVQRFTEPLTLSVSPEETTLVFSIYEPIVLESTTWESATLDPWDLAVLTGCAARLSTLESVYPDPPAAPAYVFIATLGRPDDGTVPGKVAVPGDGAAPGDDALAGHGAVRGGAAPG
jgi:environmental stress-induced protein Ves